ncbi:ubiquinone biosynthesis protein Coq4 [Catenaria anguillulae PL171]|uniref:4-hydroxy-3-methoxy-5-polyprenylbenzoate decarboxylase n=1 Tax=Catenaria anguillulae PL171 TaxID=765915 RepID=A0A1Y2H9M7_9FUNG|nr:ubiquinone biosynthesis protein Coq4 [Catenaria anguillulae PL171]
MTTSYSVASARKLYPSHIPTQAWEKAFLTVACSLKAIHDPLRADMVAAVGETLGPPALGRMRLQLLATPTGRRILRDRPLISSQTLSPTYLSSLSPSTFGGAYYHHFMHPHGYLPESRAPVRFVDDGELAYIMLRYRQVHDFWHALTGLPPTVEGELALKVFEYVQTGLPMTLLAGLVAPVQLGRRQQKRLYGELVPWAIRAGIKAKPLMGVYYEEWLERDLNEMRRELRIEVAPEIEDSTLTNAK